MALPAAPLGAAELEERLDAALDAVLSLRRTAAPLARALARRSRAEQDFVLHWAEAISHYNPEMAYHICAHAPAALEGMDLDSARGWVLRAMDVFDQGGLYPALEVLRGHAAWAQASQQRHQGAALEEQAPVLGLFLRGLSGRALKLAQADTPATDTETLFLPAVLNRFARRADNQALYKALAVQLWAHGRWGSFQAEVLECLRPHAADSRALGLYQALERLRLRARIGQELPGMARQMQALAALAGEPACPEGWEDCIQPLASSTATAFDSLAAMQRLHAAGHSAPESCYAGALPVQAMLEVLQRRLPEDRKRLRETLGEIVREQRPPPADGGVPAPAPEFSLAQDADSAAEGRYELHLDGVPVPIPEALRATLDSISQDLGRVPDEYLQAAGAGGYDMATSGEVEAGAAADDGLLYDEWDHERQHYRRGWCALRELAVFPADAGFAARTRRKHRGLARRLRHSFEALRGEDRLLKRQPDGAQVDIDALVEGHADLAAGRELPAGLFLRLRRVARNIAVLFMVDMSGSTKGWINDAERESLLLLCDALEALGDRYAIYGFSGMTRKKCEIYRIKTFDEAYGPLVERRIAGITPQDYTRMGVAIRHLSRMLAAVEARTRLLITLSDGKPDDLDHYRGAYGIEDTRKALVEAKHLGIHPYCITIDETARDYLPHMYGAVNWTLVDDVARLPWKVSDIYRRLTT